VAKQQYINNIIIKCRIPEQHIILSQLKNVLLDRDE